jgi:hypothetical protein
VEDEMMIQVRVALLMETRSVVRRHLFGTVRMVVLEAVEAVLDIVHYWVQPMEVLMLVGAILLG